MPALLSRINAIVSVAKTLRYTVGDESPVTEEEFKVVWEAFSRKVLEAGNTPSPLPEMKDWTAKQKKIWHLLWDSELIY